MDDTVKLIVEIPKAMYEDIKTGKDGYSNYVHTAIRNGTPLDDIKAEIEQIRLHSARFRTSDGNVVYVDSKNVLDILKQHRQGK